MDQTLWNKANVIRQNEMQHQWPHSKLKNLGIYIVVAVEGSYLSMIKRQVGGRQFLQTLNICSTKRRCKHASCKPSCAKRRNTRTERVHVFSVKGAINFIRTSGFTTFKYLQGRIYIVGGNSRCHSCIINSSGMCSSIKEREVAPGQVNK